MRYYQNQFSDMIFNHFNLVHRVNTYFYKIHFNIIHLVFLILVLVILAKEFCIHVSNLNYVSRPV